MCERPAYRAPTPRGQFLGVSTEGGDFGTTDRQEFGTTVIEGQERVGSVPFGFMLDEDGSHLVPVKAEQKVITKARNLRGLGMTYRAVAEKLGKLGFKSRTGQKFDPTQVRRMVMAG